MKLLPASEKLGKQSKNWNEKKVDLKNSNLCQPQFGMFCEYWTFSVVLGFTCSKLTRLCSAGAESVPSFSPEAIEALLVKICSILCLKWLFPQLNGSARTSWTSNGCNVANNARFPPGKKTGHPWLSRQHGCAIFTSKKCNFGGVWHHRIFLVEFLKILGSKNPSILRSTFFSIPFFDGFPVFSEAVSTFTWKFRFEIGFLCGFYVCQTILTSVYPPDE